MGHLEKAINTDDLDWLEQTFEENAQIVAREIGYYVDGSAYTNGKPNVEIDIERAKHIIERIKTRIIVRQAR